MNEFVHFTSGILKNGLNYVVGLPNKFYRKLRRRGASVGSTLHGKVWVVVGKDKDGNPKYERIEFTGRIAKCGRWSYQIFFPKDVEKELAKHYRNYHRVVVVEVVGVDAQ